MRTIILTLAALALLFGFVVSNAHPTQEKSPMNVKRITPVLLVKEIEPLLPFWVDRLGFAKTIEVPEGNKLGFATFQKGSVEVMYQTYSSVEKDAPDPAAFRRQLKEIDDQLDALESRYPSIKSPR